jgi:hypothetical protein
VQATNRDCQLGPDSDGGALLQEGEEEQGKKERRRRERLAWDKGQENIPNPLQDIPSAGYKQGLPAWPRF